MPTPAPPASAGGVRRLRPRTWVLLGVVTALLLVTGGGVALARHQATLERQRAALDRWSQDVRQWEDDVLALVPEPALRLAPLVSGSATETAEGIEAVRTRCDEAASAAVVVADGATAPPAPVGLGDVDGRAAVEDRVSTVEAAVTAYQDGVAGAAAQMAALCGLYPDLAQLTLDQSGALSTLEGLLGVCETEESGCLPREVAAWNGIADTVTTAYVEGEQRRGDLYEQHCPAPALAAVCETVTAGTRTLVPLYQAYADALRTGQDTTVTAARDALATASSTQEQSLHAALTAVVGADAAPADGEESAELTASVLLAQVTRQVALDADAAWLAADDELLVAVG